MSDQEKDPFVKACSVCGEDCIWFSDTKPICRICNDPARLRSELSAAKEKIEKLSFAVEVAKGAVSEWTQQLEAERTARKEAEEKRDFYLDRAHEIADQRDKAESERDRLQAEINEAHAIIDKTEEETPKGALPFRISNGTFVRILEENKARRTALESERDTLQAKLDGAHELPLCDAGSIYLKPEVYYRFWASDGCGRCTELAARASGALHALALTKSIIKHHPLTPKKDTP
jgi:hypothetical protein